MKHSPLILSLSLFASFSLLPISAASSASDIQVNRAKTASKKVKAVKATSVKPSANVRQAATALNLESQKPEPLKLASSELPQSFPVAAGNVTNNPYFANQPAAILPLSARPAQSIAATTVAPAATGVVAAAAPSAVVPVTAPESVVAAAPVPVTPVIAAPAPAAPSPVALPSLEPPNYAAAVNAAPTPVAVNPFKAPVAAYPTWNGTPAGYKNPYLSYQAQPVKVQDAIKSFSDFGSGFKFSWPSLPQFPNLAAAAVAPPATSMAAPQVQAPVVTQLPKQIQMPVQIPVQVNRQQATSPSSNPVNSIFASLKMMIPLTGDSNILPTIKKVYPTGEKPLVVLNFKCPTEVIGITPPPMKLLHEAVNFGFDGLNKTNLLSFNLQQVCS